MVDEVEAARTQGVHALPRDGGLPPAAQFFFTFLDFSALGPLDGDTLSLRWDDGDAVLAPPPVGTDTFLAVRPVGEGELRVTLRASAAAFPDESAFASFTGALRSAMADGADGAGGGDGAVGAEAANPAPRTRVTTVGQESEPVTHDPSPAVGVLDSALVGYLPAPGQLAALGSPGGPAAEAASREQLRHLLFPDGRPRLVEEIGTPLGRSGFVCLPLFADELASTSDLADRTARAVEYARRWVRAASRSRA